MSESIPEEFICPITQTIMNDPYVDTDGNSYEKEAIVDWLRRQSASPITRNPMTIHNIFPNRTLRSLIENFRAQHPNFARAESKIADFSESKSELYNPREVRMRLGRKPLLLYAVIDVSGSMQNSCDNKLSYGTTESESFSRLDLVKHTLNTIISSLTEDDKICVISFSTAAKVIIKPTPISATNKATLMTKVDQLEPEGQTNIWDGMRVAIEEISSLEASLRGDAKNDDSQDFVDDVNVHIYLLTDGEPTINPPGPIETTIQNYIQRKCTRIVPTVSTFGYGYQLDSQMLLNIANIRTTGTFGFIPDASMVGTVFINALTNSLYMQSYRESVRVHFTESVSYMSDLYASLVRCLSRLVHPNTSPEERSRDLSALLHETQHTLDIHARERHRNGVSEENNALIERFLSGLVKDIAPTHDPSLGQVHKAIQDEYLDKWGIHYLRSVLSAFQAQQCINFKDQAMQTFQQCGEQLLQSREHIEDVFLALPAPRPSISHGGYYPSPAGRGGGGGGGRLAPAAATAPVDMARYYNVSGGCFTGESYVLTAGGKLRRVQHLRRGDTVCSDAGLTQVHAVVCTAYTGPVVRIGDNMALTAYHPVHLRGADYFPCDLLRDGLRPQGLAVSSSHCQDGRVYDVVLDNRALLLCPVSLRDEAGPWNQMAVATLGHTCERPKFRHGYFGSEKVVEDLQRHFQAAGDVWRLSAQDTYLRDATGQVCGIHFAHSE